MLFYKIILSDYKITTLTHCLLNRYSIKRYFYFVKSMLLTTVFLLIK